MINEAGRRAIQNAINYLKDNKYRYECAIRAGQVQVGWDLIVVDHERRIAELEKNLDTGGS